MSILAEADALINGGRQEDYGCPRKNFENIAKIWSVILDIEVEWYHVPACMAGLKLARLAHTPHHEDSWKDMAGYAGTWELAKNG